MEHRVIELRQVRSFDQVLSATFSFVRIVFKPFFKSQLIIAGPFLLLGAVLYSIAYAPLLSMMGDPESMRSFDFDNLPFMMLQIGVAFIFILASALLLFTATYSFVILYTGARGVPPTPGEVWQRTKQSLGRVVATGFTLGAIAFAVFAAMIAIIATGDIGGILVGLIAFFILVPLSIYLSVSLSPVFMVRMQEPIGLFESFSRSIGLVRGYWWQTFGVLFLIYLVTTIITYTFMIPQSIFQVLQQSVTDEQTGMIYTVLIAVFTALMFIVSQLSSALYNIAIAIQYYNLVERKEAVGLRGRVSDLESITPPEGAA